MKSYTDIGQSKKLAEILPLESADMYYDGFGRLPQGYAYTLIYPNSFEYDKPCWSLAALLDALMTFTTPTAFSVKVSVPSLIKTEDGYKLTYTGDVEVPIESVANNAIDCCVNIIIKLNELNLL